MTVIEIGRILLHALCRNILIMIPELWLPIIEEGSRLVAVAVVENALGSLSVGGTQVR